MKTKTISTLHSYRLRPETMPALTGGTGEGGTTGSNGGGSGEPDLPPVIWPDDTSSARLYSPPA
ncbi:hypothetical protein AB9P05_06615 [Roseivirga sp. BDSF3-8]|uniref:hypothetical protein n=1 Tax=Roseivirga sp. BDSF3-8 TaxID=3241598 RepID=UPI003531F4B8